MKIVSMAYTLIALLIFIARPTAAGAVSPEFMSASTLWHHLQKNQPVTIVDVRSKSDYDTLHIPGAIHIPLHAVKTKAFLTSGTCVLVNNGFVRQPLLPEYEKIRETGIAAFVLLGGLNAWQEHQRPLKGDVFARDELSLVTPRQVYQETEPDSFLPVDLSGPKQPPLFSEAVYLRPKNKGFYPTLAGYTQTHPTGRILVFNENGTGYDDLRQQIRSAGMDNLFFLKGGANAYRRYLDNLESARTPRSQRMQSVQKKGCKRCGDQQER